MFSNGKLFFIVEHLFHCECFKGVDSYEINLQWWNYRDYKWVLNGIA